MEKHGQITKKQSKNESKINGNPDKIDENDSPAAYPTELESQTEPEVGKVEKRRHPKIDCGCPNTLNSKEHSVLAEHSTTKQH